MTSTTSNQPTAAQPIDLDSLPLYFNREYYRVEDVRAALARQQPTASEQASAAPSNDTHSALQYIHDTFKRDLDAGYKTKDKEFAVSIAAAVLSAELSDDLRGPLTDAQQEDCRILYNNLKHLQSGGYYVADDVIRRASVYGYSNGRKDFGEPDGAAAKSEQAPCPSCGGKGQVRAAHIPGGWAKCGECSGRVAAKTEQPPSGNTGEVAASVKTWQERSDEAMHTETWYPPGHYKDLEIADLRAQLARQRQAVPYAQEDPVLFECVKALSIGYTELDHQNSTLHCADCNADLDNGEHAPGCLVLRAREYLAAAPAAPHAQAEPAARVDRIISASGLAEVSVFLESALKVGTVFYAAAAHAAAAPSAEQATPLGDLWIHEDMDRDAAASAMNAPRKDLKAAHKKAVDDVIYWRRRALSAEVSVGTATNTEQPPSGNTGEVAASDNLPAWIDCLKGGDPTTDSLIEHIIDLRAQLARQRQAASHAPVGFVVVPKTLTEAMHVAMVRAIVRSTGNDDCPPNAWAAALAAAPAAPHAQAEPVAWLKFWARQSMRGSADNGPEHGEGFEVCQQGDVGDDGEYAFPVYAAPVPQEAEQADRKQN